MPVKQQLLNHFKFLNSAVKKLGASALLDVESFQVQVRKENSVLMLYPQFVIYRNGKKRYAHRFQEDCVRFCGWRPYKDKSNELFAFKLQLKDALAKHGVRMPAHSVSHSLDTGAVIIKRQLSSFADTIQGPFESCAGKTLNPRYGEYFEQFIRGDILKIWFWNATPVCYEQQKMPALMGDGRSAIYELIKRKVKADEYEKALKNVHDVLQFQKIQPDTVLKESENILIDFRYGSRLARQNDIMDVEINANNQSSAHWIQEQLLPLGNTLWNLLPANIRQGMVYTVDAILDESKQVWFLEANANPFVHPYVYLPMVSNYLRPAVARADDVLVIN